MLRQEDTPGVERWEGELVRENIYITKYIFILLLFTFIPFIIYPSLRINIFPPWAPYSSNIKSKIKQCDFQLHLWRDVAMSQSSNHWYQDQGCGIHVWYTGGGRDRCAHMR